jgi:phospholipid/cholesterol/gamma-HCH transport system permease protein
MTSPAAPAVEEKRGAPSPLRALDAASDRFVSRTRLAGGALVWVVLLLVSRRARAGSGVILREIDALGVGAVRLITSASILVGIIATVQVAYQLAPLGAEIMSTRTLAWFTARELGPLVVALLVVARSASAIAGELAYMSANSEIDAMRAMGLDPVKYLVAPKLAALLISLPALTILSIALITLGGWIGGTLVVGVSTNYYLEDFRTALELRDVVIGMGKSILFAFVLAVVASDEGLRERRTASIGQAATRAVVFCLIAILAVDTLINTVFYFIPGLV